GSAFVTIQTLFAAYFVLPRRGDISPRHQARGEGEGGRYAEHHLPFGVDGDAAPVEDAEVAGIDQRTVQRWRGITPLVVQFVEADATGQLIEHGDAPHVLFLQRGRREGQGGDGLGLGREIFGNCAAG